MQKEIGITVRGNPDLWVSEHETFGIDDGRILKEIQYLKPAAGERKFFVISFDFITSEAQNALLKVFEEPVGKTHFFLIIPTEEILLPTLRSRLSVIDMREAREFEDLGKFLTSSPAERLSYIQRIIEEKDKTRAIAFLGSLERYLHKDANTKLLVEYAGVFEEIIRARSYLRDRSPSVKMLLDHIALIV
ncbi:hypothetical protein EPN83_02420 [Patescibacteria group bacterium]|nr:MAG: hypothetical protein EPN83_02420 [Patescibacteria group bacterium]